MTKMAREMQLKSEGIIVCMKPTNYMYVFCPLIDATTSHLDTVLAIVNQAEKFLTAHGQIKICLDADMQL